MNDASPRFVALCPSGHRVRGPVSMRGKQVICPRCSATFTFGEDCTPKPAAIEEDSATDVLSPVSVTDTGVMRIIGDWKPPSNGTSDWGPMVKMDTQSHEDSDANDSSDVQVTSDGDTVRMSVASRRGNIK
ncbi:hypothetical protein SAMN06265222_116124 [Neorhodopirellula lusitana]|uniref:Uncharacterized protein n=1 Tax=Neorhodopirellula lusitana TaxID=445327 RepID=A0ABY1QNQ2_9BACT|nr:hypothetical protein [Neorhodopirellula lusitana]SMP73435.1 hypothetical protein SAMN06265222_116124 [Neorhodopirellula lusitana]